MVSFLIACAFAIAVVLMGDVLVEMRVRAAAANMQLEANRKTHNEVLLTEYDPVTDTYYATGAREKIDERLFEEVGCDELALVEETERELEALGWR